MKQNSGIAGRIIALFLAIPASLWGYWFYSILPPIDHFFDWMGLVWIAILLPGYLVTACYWFRVFVSPQLKYRYAIWLLSMQVQGIWLIFCGLFSVLSIFTPPNNSIESSTWLLVLWWTYAFGLSCLAFWLDTRGRDAIDDFPEG